jgi:hypothetical protein
VLVWNQPGWSQKRRQVSMHVLWPLTQPAFPDFENFPTRFGQSGDVSRVTFFVPSNFRRPVRRVGPSRLTQFAAMAVPVTAAHLYNFPTRHKHDVRLPRQILTVKAEAVAHPMKQATNRHLRLRISCPVGLHCFPRAGSNVRPRLVLSHAGRLPPVSRVPGETAFSRAVVSRPWLPPTVLRP